MDKMGFNQFYVQNDQPSTSYSSRDWDRLSNSWQLTMYLTIPGSEEPVDKPSVTYSYQPLKGKSFDEVMEEVLEDRGEAWERLADL